MKVLGTPLHPRAQMAETVRANVRQLLVDILGDRVGHAMLLAAGRFHFRQIYGREMGFLYAGNMAGCDALADVIFAFCERMWRERYLTQTVNGMPNPAYDGLSPKQLLDTVEYTSPPTQREIEEANVLEIAGDERGMRVFYEGSARVRKGADLGERKVPLSRDEITKILKGEA